MRRRARMRVAASHQVDETNWRNASITSAPSHDGTFETRCYHSATTFGKGVWIMGRLRPLDADSGHSAGIRLMTTRALRALALAASFFTIHAHAEPPVRNAYFGDLHVHTKYSADAYNSGARTGPDAAYAFAKGAPLRHPAGQTIRMRGAPLDFLAVTDHAEYLGNVTALGDSADPSSETDTWRGYPRLCERGVRRRLRAGPQHWRDGS